MGLHFWHAVKSHYALCKGKCTTSWFNRFNSPQSQISPQMLQVTEEEIKKHSSSLLIQVGYTNWLCKYHTFLWLVQASIGCMLPTNHSPNKVKQLNVIHLIPRIRAVATHMAVGNFHTGTTKGTLVIIKICCWTLSKLFHEKMAQTHLVKILQLLYKPNFNITVSRDGHLILS